MTYHIHPVYPRTFYFFITRQGC